MNRARLVTALVLAAVASAPLALAQKPKPDSKPTGDKPATSASPSSSPAPSTSAPATAPSGSAAGGENQDAWATATNTNKHGALNPGEGGDSDDPSDVTEAPGKSYYFIGLRYRGNIVPRFMLNIFVDEGKTIYTNAIGVEFDMRKDEFSLIPAITYAEFGTGDILFKEKNKPSTIVGNYSIVNSGLKALFFTGDLLWSTKLGGSPKWSFEYGAGFGLGIIFGDLITNWVLLDQAGGVVAADDGRRFRYCQTEGEGGNGSGCNKTDHQNSTVAKVGGYTEPSWANGGSKPNIFPHIAIPQFSLRFKPVKQFEARFSLGFSLTGFLFGLSGGYGLERPEKKAIADGMPQFRFQ